MKNSKWKLNTSHLGKFEEYKHLFANHGIILDASHIDLPEIDSEPINVVVHKASQLEDHILVDDTSLEVEGASVGIHVRWLLEHLPNYVGHQALWTTLLAYRESHKVHIYRGSIPGKIVEPQGTAGFGFDSVFLPDGSPATLAQYKPDHFNARAKAVEAFVKDVLWTIRPIIEEWKGPWQIDHLT
jgi:XTP/dITP diphosphohydrolase